MHAYRFWNPEHTTQHDGFVYFAPTEKEHCECCDGKKTKLHKGLAYHFEYTGADGEPVVFVTGPSCFKKPFEGIGPVPAKSTVPNIGCDYIDQTLATEGDDICPAQVKPSSKIQADHKKATHGQISDAEKRRQQAATNVLIRQVFLKRIGVDVRQPQLDQYVVAAMRGELSDAQADYIERFVERGVAMGRPSLKEAQDLLFVERQVRQLMRRPLDWKSRNFCQDMLSTILPRKRPNQRAWGASEKEMKWLEDLTAEHKLSLHRVGIRFSKREAEVQANKARFAQRQPK